MSEISQLESRIAQMEIETTQSAATTRTLEFEVNMLKSKLQQTRADLETLNMEHNSVKSQLQEAQTERDQLIGKVKQMEASHHLEMERLRLQHQQELYLMKQK